MVLAGQCFDGYCALLPEIVSCSLREGPFDEGLRGDDFVGTGLTGVACRWDDWV